MKQRYITLREAAKISNYAPDYVGQLIRSGKLPGKEVYCNTAWLTTEEAVLAYKNKKKEGVIATFLGVWKQKALSERKISGFARAAAYAGLLIFFITSLILGYALLRRTEHLRKLEEIQKQDKLLEANILDIAL